MHRSTLCNWLVENAGGACCFRKHANSKQGYSYYAGGCKNVQFAMPEGTHSFTTLHPTLSHPVSGITADAILLNHVDGADAAEAATGTTRIAQDFLPLVRRQLARQLFRLMQMEGIVPGASE